MSDEKAVAVQQPTNPLKAFFMQDSVQKSIREIVKDNAPQFTTTLLQIANGSDALKKANPLTLMSAALTAAALDLPINPNLGFAYIVPYKGQAAFQMGWKGYVQLAQRSGLYKTIHTTEVYENQLEDFDYMTGEFTLKKGVAPAGKVVGYLAYFRLLNGFEKALYMSKEQMQIHAKKYSQSYQRGGGVWADGEDGFNAMSKKTVLKLLLNRFGPLSVQVQRAIVADMGVIGEAPEDITYVDNTGVERIEIDKEQERVEKLIANCKTTADLRKLKEQIGNDRPDLIDIVAGKIDEFTIAGKA